MSAAASRIASVLSVVTIALAFAAGCGGRMPDGLGHRDGQLAPCPDKPNCVFSGAPDEAHSIPAFEIVGSPATSWAGLRAVVESDDSAEIVTAESEYLHAVYTSALMRYRDDVEFLLHEPAGEIRVRSASRVGHGDMGVNRARIEAIRAALADKSLVSAAATD